MVAILVTAFILPYAQHFCLQSLLEKRHFWIGSHLLYSRQSWCWTAEDISHSTVKGPIYIPEIKRGLDEVFKISFCLSLLKLGNIHIIINSVNVDYYYYCCYYHHDTIITTISKHKLNRHCTWQCMCIISFNSPHNKPIVRWDHHDLKDGNIHQGIVCGNNLDILKNQRFNLNRSW